MALLFVILLLFVGKLMAHYSHCEQASCTNIHVCYNCTTLMDAGCLETQTHQDAQSCKTALSSSQLSKASYVQATGTCELSKSDFGIYYSDSIDLLFYKTCNIGCSNYTITKLDHITISVGKIDYSNKTSSLTWCQEQCIPPSVHGCSFVYKPNKADCFIYLTCHGNCTTSTQSGSYLYTVTCNDIQNVDCPTPLDPVNGSVNTSDEFTHGDQAFFTCNEGYTLNGSTTVNCRSNGTWDDLAPICVPVDCKPPLSLTNGNVIYSSTIYGARADYKCNSGFTLFGSNYSICTSNATWERKERICVFAGRNVTADPTYRNLYIMPCLCYHNKTFVNLTQEEIIKKLTADMEINTKGTAVALNKHISRSDPRESSKAIGIVAVVILALLCCLLVCCDLITIRANIRRKQK